MLDHPRSAIVGLSLIFNFGVDPVYSVGNIAIFIFFRFGLKLPIHAHIWWIWGHTFRHMVTQKDHPCAETRRLSHEA